MCRTHHPPALQFGAVCATIVITGPPGTGKSAAGRAVAERQGSAFVDLDEAIAAAAGRSIAEIFAHEGETGFRTREREAVRALALAHEMPCVIATGGGTCLDTDNRADLTALGPIVCLTAPAAAIAERLGADRARPRPLLGGSRPTVAAVEALLATRQPLYDSFPLQVDTTGRRIADIAAGILDLVAPDSPPGASASPRPRSGRGVAERSEAGVRAIPVRASVESLPRGPRPGYGVLVGPGLLDHLGLHLTARGITGRAVIVTDTNVGPLYAGQACDSLKAAGIDAATVELPAGESSKTMETVARLYDAFLAHRLDRDGTVIALGGGVVGDTSGFAAATYLRGVTLAMVPTSLLAMVDAAIGGKTGVNLPAGKNLAGAYKHPALVLADPTVLATLPPDVVSEGLAEVVKAAIIADPELFAELERAGVPTGGDAAAWTEVVARSARVKAAIVSDDPAEHGRRILLNLGHTFAHALEKATDYRMTHGQAVAVGLVAAARLAERVGIATEAGLADRVEALLRALGLPVRWSGPAVTDVQAAMWVDKKRAGGRLRFVLPAAVGDVRVVEDVPTEDVREVLRGMTRQ